MPRDLAMMPSWVGSLKAGKDTAEAFLKLAWQMATPQQKQYMVKASVGGTPAAILAYLGSTDTGKQIIARTQEKALDIATATPGALYKGATTAGELGMDALKATGRGIKRTADWLTGDSDPTVDDDVIMYPSQGSSSGTRVPRRMGNHFLVGGPWRSRHRRANRKYNAYMGRKTMRRSFYK